MRTVSLLIGLCIFICSCKAQHEHIDPPSSNELRLYSKQTNRTDPGVYSSLYQSLPHDFDSMNRLIKCQLIHPLEAAERGDDPLKLSQDGKTTNVESILRKLYEMDSTGLYYGRRYEDRLVVACYHHAILLASILRYQGHPTRLRAGYSRFFEDRMDVRFSHIVCEAWSEKEQRWIMLDSDRELVDMDEDDFDLAGKAWFNLKEGKYDPEKYLASISRGLKGTIFLMELDASFLVGNEKMYWDLPAIALEDISYFDDLDPELEAQLEKLAGLCIHPDRKTKSIQNLYRQIPGFKSAGLSYKDYVELLLKRQ